MGTDLLLLTIYFICIGYVVYQMALELEAKLEDQVKLVPAFEDLELSITNQLQRQNISDVKVSILVGEASPLGGGSTLGLSIPIPQSSDSGSGTAVAGQLLIQVLPQGARPIEPPIPALTVQVLNQVPGLQVTVDWDSSTLTRFSNQAQRVIRYTPGIGIDLTHVQAASVINPNQILNATVTSEDTFGRDAESHLLQLSTPLISLQQALGLKPPLRTYSLYLMLRLYSTLTPALQGMPLIIPMKFQIELLPATSVIPLVNYLGNR